MTGLAFTLLFLRILLLAVIGIFPALEVAKTTREAMITYIYPIRNRKNIVTVLIIAVLAGIFVAVNFTIPMANFLYLLFTGS